jgi:predicted acylesterase/phospholipase RssA
MMPEDSYSDCYTWEACRATSAATTFFDPITIGPMKQSFADGAVAYNNPVQHVYREAQQMWPDRMKDALLITIGTGAAPGPSFEGNAVQVVAAMKKSSHRQKKRTMTLPMIILRCWILGASFDSMYFREWRTCV